MASSGSPPDEAQDAVPPDPDLYAIVESELHAIAANLMRAERSNHTLQPTALMNEAWLRLSGADQRWRDHAHFVRTAARTMRRVLVEHARARARDKRDGGNRLTLATKLLGAAERPEDLLTIEDALGRLEALDPELARIVELRVFGGLDNPTIAVAIERSLRSVERGWRLARAFLAKELRS